MRLDAERVHHTALTVLRALGPAAPLLRRVLAPRDPVLRVRALGLELPSPLGLAAGFDKDATAVAALQGLGFGFVEVGTLTPRAQPGNPRPRLFRLPADGGLLNRMGFNNGGAPAAAARLAGHAGVVAVNVGKNKDATDAVADFAAAAAAVTGVADLVVVNVSSPNTPGLRDLQAVSQLRPIVAAVRAAAPGVPVLVKIAPDLADEDVDRIAALALEIGLDGLVATNTTLSREGLRHPGVAELGPGGVSGAPLATRSLEVLVRLRAIVGDHIVLVSVGGVASAADAYARIRAGATLVQAYTGFVLGGPLWPARTSRELARLVRADGYASVTDATGADAPGVSADGP